MNKAERLRIGVVMWFVALLMMIGCAHNNGKPYTALDYAKVSENNLNNGFQVAISLVPEMKKFPDTTVQAAYPKALDILEQAGLAIKAYGNAIRIWELSGKRPTDIMALKQKAQALIDTVTNMLVMYKILK